VIRNTTFVYLQPFLHDLVRLEANRQNRTSSNVAESLILDGLSDLTGVTGLSFEQVQKAASRLMTGQKVIYGILFFRNGFLL
jgi:hypothetical protein